MFSLILKDILIQKKTVLFSLVYFIVLIFAFQYLQYSTLTICVVALSYMLVVTACAHDDKNKAETVLNSLPLRRSDIVLSKYLSVLVYYMLGVILYFILSAAANLAALPVKVHPITVEGLIGSLLAVVLMNGIYFPVFFKFGYLKSRVVSFIMFFAVFFGFSFVVSALQEFGKNETVIKVLNFLSKISDMQAAVGLIALTAAILALSYMLSLKYYRAKEF